MSIINAKLLGSFRCAAVSGENGLFSDSCGVTFKKGYCQERGKETNENFNWTKASARACLINKSVILKGELCGKSEASLHFEDINFQTGY